MRGGGAGGGSSKEGVPRQRASRGHGMDRVRESHQRWCERTDTRSKCEVVLSVPTLMATETADR